MILSLSLSLVDSSGDLVGASRNALDHLRGGRGSGAAAPGCGAISTLGRMVSFGGGGGTCGQAQTECGTCSGGRNTSGVRMMAGRRVGKGAVAGGCAFEVVVSAVALVVATLSFSSSRPRRC